MVNFSMAHSIVFTRHRLLIQIKNQVNGRFTKNVIGGTKRVKQSDIVNFIIYCNHHFVFTRRRIEIRIWNP